MSTGFQFFEGAASINSTTPQVTVRKSGQVVLTQAAVELLGEGVEQVQVGYNAKTGAVGIRPAENGGRGALRLRKQPNCRSKLLDAKRFFAHHGLAVGAVRRLPVENFGGGIIGFVVNGGTREEEPTEPQGAAKAPKGRKATADSPPRAPQGRQIPIPCPRQSRCRGSLSRQGPARLRWMRD